MSIKPPPNYESVELAKWRENARSVPAEMCSGSDRLIKRIRLFVSRFGFPEIEVGNKIKTDSMFAAHFAKEPRRTGMHELIAAEWIESLPSVKQFKNLPKKGQDSIYVTSDGNVYRGLLGNRPGKSLDFMWKTGKTTCYAMHKYTKEGGGNQDSQFKEMVALLRNFQSCNEKKVVLFVIADGAYYKGSKLIELRNHTRAQEPRSYALPIEELPAVLDDYLS